MDTSTFLGRVVATTGNIVVAALRPAGDKNIFWNAANCADAAEATQKISLLDNTPEITVYFAVGTHENNTEVNNATGRTKVLRRQATAAWFKALALDLDCGSEKPYATQKEGVAALLAALKVFHFPDPMLVNSGNGVHCYWPFTFEVKAATWEMLSKALRAALEISGVVIDWSKIHDTSMVLRPVGTHHKKQSPWKDVKLVADCPDYDPKELARLLSPWLDLPTPAAARTPRPQSQISQAILSGGFDPLDLPSTAASCRQLAALVASAGATDAMGQPVGEPMWRGSLGVAYYTLDQQASIMALCSGHPDFDLQENLDKLANWKGTGVTTCAYFEQHCPNGCNGCPEKGKINSPASLSRSTVVHYAAPAASPGGATGNPPTDPGGGPVSISIEAMQLPPTYSLKKGKLWQTVKVEKKNEEGKKLIVDDEVKVCDYPLIVIDRYVDYEEHDSTVVSWAAQYPVTGWRQFPMPMDALSAGGSDFMKYFGNKQIFIENEGLAQRLRRYMISYLGYIQEQRQSGVNLGSFGWQPDGGFLCGDRLQNIDGSETKWLPSKSLKIMAERVVTTGQQQTWVDWTKVLADPCANHIAFSMMIAGCGLLLPASGIQSFVYSLHSPTTGTGKSLALLAGNSIFGHPTKLLLQPSDTQNALFQIMGMLGSLSAAMDEITTMTEERAALFAFEAQTGREKMSLTQGRELREGTHWHAPLRVTTNISLFSMYDNFKATNEAEKVRTFEILVDDKEFVGKHDIQQMVRLLEDNHGWVAPLVAAEIIKRGGVRAVYDHYAKQFAANFSFRFSGDERFYAGGVISAYGFGCLCQELGLVHFDPKVATQWALDHATEMRRHRDISHMDAFDIIGQFLSEHNDQIIVTKDEGNGKPVVQMPIPDTAAVRLELLVDKQNPCKPGSKLMINLGKLRDFLKKSRTDVNNVIHDLKKSKAVLQEKERVTLYKGTHHTNPGQAFCLILDMQHQRFQNVLTSTKAIVSTNPALAILQGGKP